MSSSSFEEVNILTIVMWTCEHNMNSMSTCWDKLSHQVMALKTLRTSLHTSIQLFLSAPFLMAVFLLWLRNVISTLTMWLTLEGSSSPGAGPFSISWGCNMASEPVSESAILMCSSMSSQPVSQDSPCVCSAPYISGVAWERAVYLSTYNYIKGLILTSLLTQIQ